MNRKRLFWTYSTINIVILLLARWNWAIYLSGTKLWQVNFAWVQRPFGLSLLCANMLFFDYLSVSLPRAEFSELSVFIALRKPRFNRLLKLLLPRILVYLLPVVAVHLFVLSGDNWNNSLLALCGMGLIWLLLVILPMKRLSLLKQNILVFALLLGIRLILFLC